MRRHFTLIILIGMVAGLGVGWIAHDSLSAAGAASLAGYLDLVTGVFINLIKMIIAPLIFATLTSGVARMEGGGRAGRVGGRTIGWFVVAGRDRPGARNDHGQPDPAGGGPPSARTAGGRRGREARPQRQGSSSATSCRPPIVDAMARNEVLQIVVFSLFAGSAMSALGARAAMALELLEQLAAIMLKITGYVMLVAPFAVFAAIASALALHGAALIVVYAKFIGGFYLSSRSSWACCSPWPSVVLKGRLLRLAGGDPAAGSAGLFDGEFRSGLSEPARRPDPVRRISPRVAGFVLPLGYSFNLGASMLYTTFAVLFVAQIYGVELSLSQKLVLGGMLFVTSKGIAGVSRASLVVVAAALPYFHLPQSGLMLILAADQLLDMGRSGANVVGNSIAAAAVAKWEGELGDPIADVAAAVEGA